MTLEQVHGGSGLIPLTARKGLEEPVINKRRSRKGRFLRFALTLSAAFTLAFVIRSTTRLGALGNLQSETVLDICPQSSPIKPAENSELLDELERLYQSNQFKAHAFESLGGIIRVP